MRTKIRFHRISFLAGSQYDSPQDGKQAGSKTIKHEKQDGSDITNSGVADQYHAITSVRNAVKQTRDNPFINTSSHVLHTQYIHPKVTTHGHAQKIASITVASMQDSHDTIQSINASDHDTYGQFHYHKNNASSYTTMGNTLKRKSLEESTTIVEHSPWQAEISPLQQDVINIEPLDCNFLLSTPSGSTGQEGGDDGIAPKRRRLSQEVHVTNERIID